MIPAEAVEAAAKASHASRWPNAPWDALNDDAQAYARKNARLALEAAAPHMQRESREMALIARERKRKLDAVVSIAVRLGESMQGDDRELSEELYAAMGLD